MKSEKEIIQEAIEVARSIVHVQIRKGKLLAQPTDGTEKSEKIRKEEILDFDFEINALETKLNTFIWLFED